MNSLAAERYSQFLKTDFSSKQFCSPTYGSVSGARDKLSPPTSVTWVTFSYLLSHVA